MEVMGVRKEISYEQKIIKPKTKLSFLFRERK